MNVIQTLKKLLTPAGSDIYPGDLFFANKRIGYVTRKIETKGKLYFQVRWGGTTQYLIDEFSGSEIKERIETGEWYHRRTILKKDPIK